MKKIIGFITVLVLMIAVLPLQQAEATTVNKHYKVEVKTTLNVRAKPSPKAKVVGSLKNGTIVFVYNTEPGGWSKIKYNGKAGYVASGYLKNPESGKISREQAKKILSQQLDPSYQGLVSEPDSDETVNGIKYYCFVIRSINPDVVVGAEVRWVSSKDGKVYTGSDLGQIK